MSAELRSGSSINDIQGLFERCGTGRELQSIM